MYCHLSLHDTVLMYITNDLLLYAFALILMIFTDIHLNVLVVYALAHLSILYLDILAQTNKLNESSNIRSVKNKLLKIPSSYDQTHLFFKGKPNLLSVLLLLLVLCVVVGNLFSCLHIYFV